jgi:hypothetical protein
VEHGSPASTLLAVWWSPPPVTFQRKPWTRTSSNAASHCAFRTLLAQSADWFRARVPSQSATRIGSSNLTTTSCGNSARYVG